MWLHACNFVVILEHWKSFTSFAWMLSSLSVLSNFTNLTGVSNTFQFLYLRSRFFSFPLTIFHQHQAVCLSFEMKLIRSCLKHWISMLNDSFYFCLSDPCISLLLISCRFPYQRFLPVPFQVGTPDMLPGLFLFVQVTPLLWSGEYYKHHHSDSLMLFRWLLFPNMNDMKKRT